MSEAVIEEGVEEQGDGLPEGWRRVRVGELLDVEYGKALAKTKRVPGDVPVCTSAGVTGEHNEALTSGNTLVIGRKGAAGRVTLLEGPVWVTDTAFFASVPSVQNARFLELALGAAGLTLLDQSTAIPSLSRDHLNDVVLAIPPRDTQDRLVVELETRLGEISELDAQLDVAENLEDQFRQALLRDAFTGRLTHGDDLPDPDEVDEEGRPILPDGWEWRAIGRIASVRKKPRGLEVPNRVAFLPMADISETADPITRYQEREREKATSNFFKEGDLLISRITPCFENGKQGVARDVPGGFGFATTEVYALACGDEIDADYLNLVLSSQMARGELVPLMEGATGRMRLPKTALESYEIPVPPIETQAELLRVIQSSQAWEETIGREVNAVREALERIRASLLHQAFTGQLVT